MAVGKFSIAMLKALKLKTLASVGLLICVFSANAGSDDSGSFTNPIYENGADPWLEYFDGNYYLTTTTWMSQLVMRKSPTLAGLADAEPVYLWSETDPERCCNFWAYEFHRLEGPDGYRWYMMFTSGRQEDLTGQHLTVLESAGDDPMGPYQMKGSPVPGQWNIDGNYLELDGTLYLLWSEWMGEGADEEQVNLIAEMENPWTLAGDSVVLSRPEYDWETSGRRVNEAAQALQRDGRTFVVYSASYCDTPDYKLGLLEFTGSDPLNPDHWKKYPEPVFERGNGVYGPGHNGFFSSPDGTEDWIIYHGNSSETDGCGASRALRAQPYTWHDDGTPDFGEPAGPDTRVAAPSGENGPIQVTPQGAPLYLRNASDDTCLLSSVNTAQCSENTGWVIDPVGQGRFRLANAEGNFLSAGQCGADNGPWINQACQTWKIDTDEQGYLTLVNAASEEVLHPCSSEGSSEDCAKWKVSSSEPVALSSRQSGRVLSQQAQQLVQQGWQNKESQRWLINEAEHGFVYLQGFGDNQCLAVKDKSLAAGARIVSSDCSGEHSHWSLNHHSSGAVEIVSRHSGLTLDLASCGLAEGTEVNQAPANDTLCQHFFIRQVQ